MHSSRFLRPSLLALALALPASTALAYDGQDDIQGSIGFDQVFTNRTDIGKACVAQGDGKIIIAGKVSSNDGEGHQIAVARLGANGLLDPTFGNGGRVMIDLSYYSVSATEGDALGIAVDQQGRVVVAGSVKSDYGGQIYGIAIGLLADGSLDYDWATLGWFYDFAVSQVTAMGFDALGRLWLVGPVKQDNTGNWQYQLLDADGLPAGDGIVDRDYTSSFPTAIAFAPNGDALIGGFGFPTPFASASMLISRIASSNLMVDTTFGNHGIGQYDFGSNAFLRSLALLPDRRIVMSGEVGPNLAEDVAVVTLSPDGVIDGQSWTQMVSYDLPQGGDGSGGNNRLVVQSDGKVLVAATAFTNDPSNMTHTGIARLRPTGSFDTSFGGNGTGKRVFDMPPVGNGNGDELLTCLTLANGKPVLAGSGVWSGSDFDFSFKRLGNSLDFADGFESGSTFLWSTKTP